MIRQNVVVGFPLIDRYPESVVGERLLFDRPSSGTHVERASGVERGAQHELHVTADSQ